MQHADQRRELFVNCRVRAISGRMSSSVWRLENRLMAWLNEKRAGQSVLASTVAVWCR
jgi:hypothetical protein